MCSVVRGQASRCYSALFANDMGAVVFFKTVAPVEPVSLVKRICEDAMNEPLRKRTRFVKRLSPMTLMGRASEEGLEKVATEVLGPRFHQQPIQPQKVSDTLRRACHPAATSQLWLLADDAMTISD